MSWVWDFLRRDVVTVFALPGDRRYWRHRADERLGNPPQGATSNQ